MTQASTVDRRASANPSLTLARLRAERRALLACHHELLTYGIGSQTLEITDRLTEIAAESGALIDQIIALDARGDFTPIEVSP